MALIRKPLPDDGAAPLAGLHDAAAAAHSATNRLPSTAAFQSGDFIWPKKPGSIVLYNAASTETATEGEAARWEQEKKQFLATLPAHSKHLADSDVKRLQRLSFQDFHALYAGDSPSAEAALLFGTGPIYVGHVGIVEIDAEGMPWVIEALFDRGVVRQPYSQWLEGRPGEIVWHGRLRDSSPVDRAKIVAAASLHIGKPYDFWNFDLSDESGFYCSKLVWLSVWRALGLAIDGAENPQRSFWLSPKQLLYANAVARLNDPGKYATAWNPAPQGS